MNLEIEAICHIGRVRKNNEDMILIGDQLILDSTVAYTLDARERDFWIVVSDGMGGHNAGELASKTVLTEMVSIGHAIPKGFSYSGLRNWLEGHIHNIHYKLAYIGEKDPQLRGLGATLSGLLIYDQKAYVINVGDSRVYRLRGGLLTQLTNDHSLRNLLRDRTIPSNQLVNSFGGGAAARIYFDLEETALLLGDMFLICTDGLNGEVNDAMIENLLNLNAPVNEILEQALNTGGLDNISIIKVTVI